MKILYVITKSNWGGAQRHVYDLALGMRDRGYNVVVALGGDGILRKRLEDIGVKTYAIGQLGREIALGKDTGSFKEIFSIIKRERPDVLHLHSPKAAGLGALAGKLLRVKKIAYTVHGWAFNEDRPRHQKLWISMISWFTMLLTHTVILLSEYEMKQTQHFPFVKRKLILIPLGMKTPTFMSIEGAKQTIAKQIGLDLADFKKKIVIGTIAELHPNKGLKYFIDALERVCSENTTIISIIMGDGDLLSELHMQIKEKGLEGRVFLMGYVENASEYLKAYGLFVLPSVKEGLPYVLFEAGSASLPVVSTSVGGIPEIIEDMKSGVLVQPKNSKELSHAISYLIEHQLLAKQYGVALRENIIQKFGLEKMLGATEAVYLKTSLLH